MAISTNTDWKRRRRRKTNIVAVSRSLEEKGALPRAD